MVLERDGGGRKGGENNRHTGRHGNRLLEQGTERSPLQLRTGSRKRPGSGERLSRKGTPSQTASLSGTEYSNI